MPNAADTHPRANPFADEFETRFYPERAAGGFSHTDGTIAFYARVNVLLRPEMTVLDYGAGPGRSIAQDAIAWRRALRTLKGKCARVVGVDIDPAVRDNPYLDAAETVSPDGVLPLADASVDLIVADCVFEHVAAPQATARELDRVLKPGGWICARTPNRWGYIGLATNLVPNRLHVAVLRRVQPDRPADGVYPTRYRLNTRAALRRAFPPACYLHAVHTMNNEPAYFGRSALAWHLMRLAFRLTPEALGATFYAYLQKRG